MHRKVLAWCREEALFASGDRVVCAVSGGADSVAMLLCLFRLRQALGITLCAAHFNHGLRGEEAQRDEAFVRALCEGMGIDLSVGGADVARLARENGNSTETQGRLSRYAFLEALACDKIATAHNADDNAETVLLHLMRGSGLRGLCGIPPKRGRLVRPMLPFSHAELVAYLRTQNAAWVEDSTNAQDDCARNRLRHHVLPLLCRQSPQFLQHMTRQCALLRQEDALLDQLAQPLLTEAGCSVKALLSAPDALQKRALRLLVRPYLSQDVSQAHIRAMQSLLRAECPSASVSLPDGLIVRRRYDTLCIVRAEATPDAAPVRLFPEGTCLLPPWRIICRVAPVPENFKNTPYRFAIQYDKIAAAELCVRRRRTGDRLTLSGGSKTVKRLMIDRKIPRELRDTLPVLTADGQPFAVAGLGARPDLRALHGEALLVTLEKITEGEPS